MKSTNHPINSVTSKNFDRIDIDALYNRQQRRLHVEQSRYLERYTNHNLRLSFVDCGLRDNK